MVFQNAMRAGALVLAVSMLGACSGNLAADGSEKAAPGAGPENQRRRDPDDTIFAGTGLDSASLFGGDAAEEGGTGLVVNKYLWQASLDTLSFMPLGSTDPFTGVIATEWAATPGTPDERVKVTVFMQRPALEASSLKVAVYREVRTDDGLWVPQAVDPETARKLEDAILTRARQIRIAGLEEDEAAS